MIAQIDSRESKKRLLRLGVLIPVLVVTLAATLAVSAIFETISRSEDQYAVFSDAAELPPELINAVTWRPDPTDLPREMEPLTRVDITSSWILAWEQMKIVAETGDTSGVEVYFANSAREAVLSRANDWNGRSVEQLAHELRLTFYAEDGQVVGLTSVGSDLLRTQETTAGTLSRQTTESYDVVLVLDDGNWRIHHWVRRSVEDDGWIVTE